jgi:hypothetical protein
LEDLGVDGKIIINQYYVAERHLLTLENYQKKVCKHMAKENRKSPTAPGGSRRRQSKPSCFVHDDDDDHDDGYYVSFVHILCLSGL